MFLAKDQGTMNGQFIRLPTVGPWIDALVPCNKQKKEKVP